MGMRHHFKALGMATEIRKFFDRDRAQHFVDLVTEFFGQHKRRRVRAPDDIWFKTSQRKKIYVDLYFHKHYRTERYGEISYMVFAVEKIVIRQIGKHVLPYHIEVKGVDIPIPGGYIHEDSKLYQLLKDLQLWAKKVG
jgi:hypothetical protein